MSLDCPDGYIPFTGKCQECGGDFIDYRRKGPHMAVYCIRCNRFITFIPKCDLDEWRKIVKQRDQYTCQRCGKVLTPISAQAHHKMPVWFMPQKQFDTENGITLCKQCHKQLHGAGGTIKEKEDLK